MEGKPEACRSENFAYIDALYENVEIKKLLHSIQDALIILDMEGRIVDWNKSAEEIFGYTIDEVINKKVHDFIVPPQMQGKVNENLMRYRKTGKGRFIDKVTEVHGVRKDGSEVIAEISISTINLKGIVHNVGIARDITERRQTQKKLLDAMEAAQAANKAKSQFIANISHEIRTPMNGIMGFVDLLSKTPLNHMQNDYVSEIKTATDALMNLVNDLLDFEKIEANKLELEHIDFNLRKIVEEATAMFSLKAYSKGIEINAMIDNDIPEIIKGDPVKLKQVIINLISNAVKFTHMGGITISVEPVSHTNDKVDILFNISDTGIGISKHDSKKLFEPFTQVDSSTTRKYGGTGLGLSICERLVEMMSGEITIESDINQGATFSFCLSFDKVLEETVTTDYLLKDIRILIADQSPTNRMIVRNYLEGAGGIVREADTANEMFELLKNTAQERDRFHVLLLDHMPDGDWTDIAARIKADETTRDTIINLFSPYANPCDRYKADKYGISELIMKPVYKEELVNKILLSMGKPICIETHKETKANDAIVFDEHQKKNIRILLAEDNATNQKLAATILYNAGLAYDISNNGYEAVHALNNRKYDIILMDCQMPDMDGYEATKLIRLIEEDKEHTIIIAMTANAMEEDIDRCLEAGMDDYIGKPFKAEYLLKTIAKWISNKKTNLAESIEKEPVVFEEYDKTQRSIPYEECVKVNKNASLADIMMEETINNIPSILDKLSSEQHMGRADIYEIYNEFVESLPQSLDKLQSAINKGDFMEISVCAHALKGASATLRLKHMSGITSDLDQYAKSGDMIKCRLIMNNLLEYCQYNIKPVNID